MSRKFTEKRDACEVEVVSTRPGRIWILMYNILQLSIELRYNGQQKKLKRPKIWGRSGIIWILIFMIPAFFASIWFMIPTRIFFQIHYSRRLLITYWLNDFLSGNLVSFCIVSSAFKLLLHPDSVSSFVCRRYGGCFCNWKLNTRLLEKQTDYQPRFHELHRGVRGHAPPEHFGILDSRKRHILHSLDRTELIIRVFSWAILWVSLFMIPERKWKDSWFQVFKTKIQDFYMFCKYDSWFMINPLPPPNQKRAMQLAGLHPYCKTSWKARKSHVAGFTTYVYWINMSSDRLAWISGDYFESFT